MIAKRISSWEVQLSFMSNIPAFKMVGGGAKIEYKRLQSWYKKIQHLRCSVCESPYVCELYGDNTIVLDLLHEA